MPTPCPPYTTANRDLLLSFFRNSRSFMKKFLFDCFCKEDSIFLLFLLVLIMAHLVFRYYQNVMKVSFNFIVNWVKNYIFPLYWSSTVTNIHIHSQRSFYTDNKIIELSRSLNFLMMDLFTTGPNRMGTTTFRGLN